MITFLRIASRTLRMALNPSSFIYATSSAQCAFKNGRLQIVRGYLTRLRVYEALAIVFEELRKV